jgi:hypothetical protein
MPNDDRNLSNPRQRTEPSADELWDRAMRATTIYLSGEFADQPTLQAEHMIAAMMDWSLDKVRILDPENFVRTSLDVVRTVSHVLIFLGKFPVPEIDKPGKGT